MTTTSRRKTPNKRIPLHPPAATFSRNRETFAVFIPATALASRASKAGLKPYEFITQVNGKPVKSAAEGQKQLRPDVTRMSKTRVAKLAVDAPRRSHHRPDLRPCSHAHRRTRRRQTRRPDD